MRRGIEYWYDVEGHRVGKRVIESSQTTTTRYVVDANQAYAQVREELDGAGQIAARYTYGDDLLAAG